AAYGSLVEHVLLVVQHRYVGEVYPRDREGAAAVQPAERDRDEVADRREENRRVQWLRRGVVRIPRARRADVHGKPAGVVRPGQHVNGGAFGDPNLPRQVGWGAQP